ncbi:hypothetical protein ACIQPR_10840 [Streptomyces sp. NPDC091280]|uniref:hypothetical protein n=1 Tax=Streptomyces sp. NPDC091280 TaxID=3365984 RepID=UPI0037F64250
MTQLKFTSLFDNIEAHVETLPTGLRFCGSTDTAPTELTLREARVLMHGPSRNEPAAQAIWSDVLAQAATDPDPGGVSVLILVWCTVPRLRRTVWRISSRLPADRADLEAEVVQGVLEGIRAVEPLALGEAERLMRVASGRAWRFARSTAPERLVPDHANVAAVPPALPYEDGDPSPWAVHIAPPDRADGLAAPIRFTTSSRRIEGQRLGALAEGMGLGHVVHRARRPGPGRRIGTLSLAPYGSP